MQEKCKMAKIFGLSDFRGSICTTDGIFFTNSSVKRDSIYYISYQATEPTKIGHTFIKILKNQSHQKMSVIKFMLKIKLLSESFDWF